jgi:hypothetical protein
LKQDEVTLRVDTDRMTKAIQEKRKKNRWFMKKTSYSGLEKV